MDLNIARLGPLTKQMERVADSLELIASYFAGRCEAEGVMPKPKIAEKDPMRESDVQYTSDDDELIREMKQVYGILSPDEKKVMQQSLSPEQVAALEEPEE